MRLMRCNICIVVTLLGHAANVLKKLIFYGRLLFEISIVGRKIFSGGVHILHNFYVVAASHGHYLMRPYIIVEFALLGMVFFRLERLADQWLVHVI